MQVPCAVSNRTLLWRSTRSRATASLRGAQPKQDRVPSASPALKSAECRAGKEACKIAGLPMQDAFGQFGAEAQLGLAAWAVAIGISPLRSHDLEGAIHQTAIADAESRESVESRCSRRVAIACANAKTIVRSASAVRIITCVRVSSRTVPGSSDALIAFRTRRPPGASAPQQAHQSKLGKHEPPRDSDGYQPPASCAPGPKTDSPPASKAGASAPAVSARICGGRPKPKGPRAVPTSI